MAACWKQSILPGLVDYSFYNTHSLLSAVLIQVGTTRPARCNEEIRRTVHRELFDSLSESTTGDVAERSKAID